MGRRAQRRLAVPVVPRPAGSIDGSWKAFSINGRRLICHVYSELHASSAFSFLDGASLPEALVDRAAALGYRALALLDRDGLYGAPRFHLAAKRAGLKAIIGAELTIGVATTASVFRLPVLVESADGYRNLCRLVTRMKLRAPKGEGALALEELDGHTGGLVALVGRAALSGRRFGVGGLVDRIVGIFGAANVCVEVQRHLLRDEEADNQALIELASAFHVPVIATNGVRFAQPSDRPLYDVLTCIRHKTTLERAGRRLAWNAERYLKSPDAIARLFSDMPHAVAAAGELAERLSILDGRSRLPLSRIPRPCGRDDGLVSPEDHAGGCARTISSVQRACAPAGRARARSHRQARSRRLFPDRLGHCQLLPPAGDPRAGARLGGQQRRLLQPWHHGGRSGWNGSAVRALPLRGTGRVAGHRPRSAKWRSARAGDPASLRQVRRSAHRRRRRAAASAHPRRRYRQGSRSSGRGSR